MPTISRTLCSDQYLSDLFQRTGQFQTTERSWPKSERSVATVHVNGPLVEYYESKLEMNFKNWKWVWIILIWGAIVSGLKKGWLKRQSLPSLEALVKNETAWNMRKIKKNTFLNIFDASIRQQSGQIVKSRPIRVNLTHRINRIWYGPFDTAAMISKKKSGTYLMLIILCIFRVFAWEARTKNKSYHGKIARLQ